MPFFIEVTSPKKITFYGPYGSKDTTERVLFLHGWEKIEELDVWTTQGSFNESFVAQVLEDVKRVDSKPTTELPEPNVRLSMARRPGWAQGID